MDKLPELQDGSGRGTERRSTKPTHKIHKSCRARYLLAPGPSLSHHPCLLQEEQTGGYQKLMAVGTPAWRASVSAAAKCTSKPRSTTREPCECECGRERKKKAQPRLARLSRGRRGLGDCPMPHGILAAWVGRFGCMERRVMPKGGCRWRRPCAAKGSHDESPRMQGL